jgi:POT family proton-dependent oligopeptide transporter
MERELGFWQAYLLTAASLGVGIALFALWGPKFVKGAPEENVLPKASRVLVCATRNGFKLDHAKSSYQESRFGRVMPWSDDFIEEMKKGLVACRVMYVSPTVIPSIH